MMDKSLETGSPVSGDLWDALGRYLSGESPPAEADAISRWLAADPRREELVTRLDALSRRLGLASPAEAQAQAAWRHFEARLDEPDVRRLPVERRFARVGLRAAAVVVLLAGAAWMWREARIRGQGSPASPEAVLAGRTYTTAVGQTDSIGLPDGSRVVLGPASRLTLAAGYGTGRREAELNGEALFEVVHDPTLAFSVRTASAVIEDLGTTFAVRDDGVEVGIVVTSGSVLVRSRADSLGVELKAGDRGVVAAGGQVIAERASATADDLAWTHGRLVFKGAAMTVVKADLRRWYGIELQIPDPELAGRHLTASFAGEPADRVLRMIGLALGATIERRGDTAVARAP